MANDPITDEEIYKTVAAEDWTPSGKYGGYEGSTYNQALRDQKKHHDEVKRLKAEKAAKKRDQINATLNAGKSTGNILKFINENTKEEVATLLQDRLPEEIFNIGGEQFTQPGKAIYEYSEAFKEAPWHKKILMPATDQERGPVGTWVNKVFGDETPGIKEGRLTHTDAYNINAQEIAASPILNPTPDTVIPPTEVVSSSNAPVVASPEFTMDWSNYNLKPTTEAFNSEAFNLLNKNPSTLQQVAGSDMVLNSKAGQIYKQWSSVDQELSKGVMKRFNITKFNRGGETIFYDLGKGGLTDTAIGTQLSKADVIKRIHVGIADDIAATSSVSSVAPSLVSSSDVVKVAETAGATEKAYWGKGLVDKWDAMSKTTSARVIGGIGAAYQAYNLTTNWDEMDNEDKLQSGMQMVGGAMVAAQLLPGWGQALGAIGMIWDLLDGDESEFTKDVAKPVYRSIWG